MLANPVTAYVTAPAYNALAFGAIVHSTSGVNDLADALRRMKLSGLDYGFVTDDTAPNEYDQAPTYFENYLRDIHAPYIQSAITNLTENTANGSPVFSVFAGDPDPGQSLTYSIAGGNTNGAFAIHASTGKITVANSVALDFETTPVFSLTIQVLDNGVPNLLDKQVVTVNLTDIVENSNSLVLDDGEPGYSFVGSRGTSTGGFTGNLGGPAGDTQFVAGDAMGDRLARALFSGLKAGRYRVSATYRSSSVNATNATYTLLSNVAGTIYGKGVLNQRLAPNDFNYTNSYNTKAFEQVAIVNVTGTSLLVQLSDEGNGNIWADGIHIERLGATTVGPQASVFDGASAIVDDTGVADFGATGPGKAIDKVFTIRNTGDAPLMIGRATVTGAGYSMLNNLPDGTVIAPGGQATIKVRFNELMNGKFRGTLSFSTNESTPRRNPYNFALTALVTQTQYLDDGDVGFTTVGTWTTAATGRLDDVRNVQGDSVSDRFARWQFAIANPGLYRVMATWRVGNTNATNANYQIKTGVGGTLLGRVLLNQQIAPNDLTDSNDLLSPNSVWEQIASVNVTGSALLVELSDLANGRVSADSIRIERIGLLPPVTTFAGLNSNFLGLTFPFDEKRLHSLLV